MRDHVDAAGNRLVCREVQKALRSGALVKPTECAWCGSSERPIQGHHPDYDRPLMVVWICVDCHRAHHRLYASERLLFVTPKSL